MVDPEHAETALFPERVGDRLRTARMKAGLDLSDIATKTRVPLRHLSAIEAGDYASFPSATYCVGFVKAYARAIGEDEVVLARDLRTELGAVRNDPREFYDPQDADPARLPTRKLAWTAAAVLLLLVAGYAAFRSWMIADPRDAATPPAPITAEPSRPVAPRSVQAVPNPAGQVVLTAKDTVWVRIYDAADKVLLQKELAPAESFTVPADANNPQIRTGRPDLITVSVDGQEVPPLGPPEKTIKDVGISATALAARSTVAPPSPPSPSAPTGPTTQP